jgi:hypothetical protein
MLKMNDEMNKTIEDVHEVINDYLEKNISATGIPDFYAAEKVCLGAVRKSFAKIIQQLEDFAKFLSLAEIIDFYKSNGYGNHVEIKSRIWMTPFEAMNIAGRKGRDELRAIVNIEETGMFISPRNRDGEPTVPFFYIAYILDKHDMSELNPNVFYAQLSKFNHDPVGCMRKMLKDGRRA